MGIEGAITKSCPHCGGEIRAAAKLCKHCKRALDGATSLTYSNGTPHAGHPATHGAAASPQAAPVDTGLRYPAAASTATPTVAPQAAVTDDAKNPWVAAVLGFLFGPLGLLYVSFKAAGGAFAALSFISFVTGGVAALPGWLACGVVGYFHATEYNNKARRDAGSTPTPLRLPQPEVGAPISMPPTEALWAPTASATSTDQPPTSAPPAVNKFCSACGVQLAATARFCNKCGSPA